MLVYLALGAWCTVEGLLSLRDPSYWQSSLASSSGLLGFGLSLLALFALWLRRIGRAAATRLRIDDGAVTFTRRNGRRVVVRWDDPELKLDLFQIDGDPTSIVRGVDARSTYPFWVDVWTPRGFYATLESPMPREALETLRSRAFARHLPNDGSRVAFVWMPGHRAPGRLVYEREGHLRFGTSLNGRRTRFRGRLDALGA